MNDCYSLTPMDIGSAKIFGIKSHKVKGCLIRREYERWQDIAKKASQRGVEMDGYIKVMYAHRCPLVKRVSVVGYAKL